MSVMTDIREECVGLAGGVMEKPVEGPRLNVQDFAERLETVLGPAHWAQWFAGKTAWRCDPTAVYLVVDNGFAAKWIRQKFIRQITEVSAEMAGMPLRIEIEVQPGKHLCTAPPPQAPAKSTEAPAPAVTAPLLNPRHLLEDFVPGQGNQLAYHAACRAAEEPPRQYNPLFIHGHCGLGKTHLLQGICHRFARLHPAKRWLYMTGEQFTNDFLEAIRHNRMEHFRRRLRQADLLVLDDIHFLARKLRTQEEFLHTFIQVDSHGRQIVLASDRPPREIESMIESLTSRFVSGMVIRVDAPDMPTRLEILRRMARRRNWNLPDTTLVRLAREPAATVRDLEGMAHRLIARKELVSSDENSPENPTVNEKLVRDVCDRYKPLAPAAPDVIVRCVAAYFGIAARDIIGQGRHRLLSQARGISMQLARQHTGLSFPDIGRIMGKRNHSTVIGACRRVEAQMAAGEIIHWTAATGPRRESVADVMNYLGNQIHRPGQ